MSLSLKHGVILKRCFSSPQAWPYFSGFSGSLPKVSQSPLLHLQDALLQSGPSQFQLLTLLLQQAAGLLEAMVHLNVGLGQPVEAFPLGFWVFVFGRSGQV